MTEGMRRHLMIGERLLWEGRPSRRLLLLRPIDALLVPFSVFWAGFAAFWNKGVWDSGAPVDFQLFGIPFLVIGLYVTVGRFFVDAWIRRRLSYAITDRRVLVEGIRSLRALDILHLPALDLQERRDGSGTIRFGDAGSWWMGRDSGIWSPALERVPQFIQIDRARDVYRLIQEQARS